MEHLWNRRQVMGAMGKALTVGAGAGGVYALGGAGTALAIDWRKLLGEAMGQGYGLVDELEGKATAGGRPLKKGQRVESGARVEVAPGARLVLQMSDRSVFQFNGPSSLDLLLNMMRQGLLRLFYGALLAVVPHENQYLVAGPSATVGIKGTVFYREVFRQEGVMGHTMEGEMPVPSGVKDYFCTCFGETTFLKSEAEPDPQFDVYSTYHQAYFLDPRRTDPRIKAPMMNHFDEDVRALIARQSWPKHSSYWLRH